MLKRCLYIHVPAAIFIIAKAWNQHKCLGMHEWVKKIQSLWDILTKFMEDVYYKKTKNFFKLIFEFFPWTFWRTFIYTMEYYSALKKRNPFHGNNLDEPRGH